MSMWLLTYPTSHNNLSHLTSLVWLVLERYYLVQLDRRNYNTRCECVERRSFVPAGNPARKKMAIAQAKGVNRLLLASEHNGVSIARMCVQNSRLRVADGIAIGARDMHGCCILESACHKTDLPPCAESV